MLAQALSKMDSLSKDVKSLKVSLNSAHTKIASLQSKGSDISDSDNSSTKSGKSKHKPKVGNVGKSKSEGKVKDHVFPRTQKSCLCTSSS